MRANSSSDFQRILGSLLLGASLCTVASVSSAQQKSQTPAATAPAAVEKGPKAPTKSASPAPTQTADAAEKSNNFEQKPGSAQAAAATAPTAPSEEDTAAAKEALSKGLAAYQAGDYALAADAFNNSSQLAPSLDAQFWYAMSLDLQGKTESALAAFEKFFSDPEHATLGGDRIEPARQRFEVLKTIPSTLTLQVTPASAQLRLDGEPQTGSGTFNLKLRPGKHVLLVEAPGYESTASELEVKAAQTLEQSIQLKPIPAAPAEARPTEPTPPTTAAARSRVPAYVTLGIAGAGAVVGGIFGVQALGAKSDFDKNPTAKNADAVERNALISDMAFGLAVTLGITGVVLLTSDEPAESGTPSAGALRFAPFFSAQGGGAAAHATF